MYNKDKIREALEGILSEHFWEVAVMGALKVDGEAVTAELEAAVTKCVAVIEAELPKWISIKEKLPENDENVLVLTDSEIIGEGYFCPATGKWTYDDCEWFRHTCPVRYWQPLPLPPAPEKEG